MTRVEYDMATGIVNQMKQTCTDIRRLTELKERKDIKGAQLRFFTIGPVDLGDACEVTEVEQKNILAKRINDLKIRQRDLGLDLAKL